MKCKKMGLVIAISAITLLLSPLSTVNAANLSSVVKLSEVSGSCKDITEGILSNDSVAGDEEVDWFKFTANESGEYAIYTTGATMVNSVKVSLYAQNEDTVTRKTYKNTTIFDPEAQSILFTYEMQAGESYYLAVNEGSSIDNQPINYGISVKKMSEGKDIKLEAMSKIAILSGKNQDEIVNSYAPTYLYGQIEYTNGLSALLVGGLNSSGKEDEETGLVVVGYVSGEFASGNLSMDKKSYEDFMSYKPGTYNVKVSVSDGISDYEGATTLTVADDSEVFGNASDNYMGYAVSPSYSKCGLTMYTGSFSLESDTTFALNFSSKNNIYGFTYFFTVDENGYCTDTEGSICIDGISMVTLSKGRYYFQIIVMGNVENNQLVLGDPVGRVNTTALSMDKSATVEVGSLVHLTDNLAVAPVDTTDSLVWSSDNTAVAEVSANGVVKGIAPGVANITVKSGDFSATCSVTVVAAVVKENPTVVTNPTVQNVQKVQFTKKSLSVKKGKSVKLTKYVKVNDKANVTFKKLSGNKNITVSKAGKLTVKKGLKKGTYKVKIKISANKTEKYSGASLTKTVKIKVK